MLKIFQARLQQYVSHELPYDQTRFRKGRGARDQIVNTCWIIEKARKFQKNISFCFIDYANVFDYVDHNKLWKFFKRWEYQTIWPASWETCMNIKKQQLELNMEQQTGFEFWKEYIKVVYCYPAYLTYMQSTSCKMPGWHKLESRLSGEISITTIHRWHHPYGRKWRRTKETLNGSERGEWKSWLKTQHSEN